MSDPVSKALPSPPYLHVALGAPAWPRAQFSNGIVTYVDELRRELIAQGHRVTVFTGEVGILSTSDEPVFQLKPTWGERVVRRIRRATGRRESLRDSSEMVARALKRQHRRDPFDVIEMEESFGHAGPIAAALPVPLVVKLHGPAFLTMVGEDLQSEFAKEKIRAEGEALKAVRFLMSPSRCTLEETIDYYRLQPKFAAHIVNPLGDENVQQWSLDTCDKETVLYVGRFDLIKGADLLIRAFGLLLQKRPSLKLIFVGPDPGLLNDRGPPIRLDDFASSIGGESLRTAISYRGSLPPEQIKALRTCALVSVLSSRRENQPYAALEAMLQGCPVVCNDSSGLSELVAHEVTGLKASRDDCEDLAFQILRVIENPEMGARLGAAARAYVLRAHSPKSVAARTLDVYRQAIAHCQ